MKKVVSVGSAIGTNFLNQLDELSDIREGYEKSTLRNSNKELYEILAKVYCIFEDMNKNKSEFESNIKFLKSKFKERNIKIQKNTSWLTVLIRYVFNVDRVRSYNYNRVISYAKESGIAPDELSQFIEEQGGIESCKKIMVLKDSGKKIDIDHDIYNILENLDDYDAVAKIDLGETKLKIEDDCKLVFTVGRLGADEKTIELFGVVNSMTRQLRYKLLKLIAKDLFFRIGKSVEQVEAEDEETLAKVYKLMDQSFACPICNAGHGKGSKGSLCDKHAEEALEIQI